MKSKARSFLILWVAVFVLGVLPASASEAALAAPGVLSARDAIAERAHFKGRDSHKAKSGFSVATPALSALVVIPDNPLPIQKFAAEELIEHVFASTGVRLPLMRERESKAESASRPRIYIGGVRALQNIGVRGAAGFGEEYRLKPEQISLVSSDAARQAKNVSTKAKRKVFDLETLPPNGFLLKTRGNALYLAGRDENGPPLADNTNAGTLFAVYEWLERQVGVRWLWPGKVGTQVPRLGVLSSGRWNVLAQPPLLHARLRQMIGRKNWIPDAGGFTDSQRAQVVADEVLWHRRNRLARGVSLEYGHGYEDYWQRLHQTHPEYYNLLPDGTRRSDSLYHGGAYANYPKAPLQTKLNRNVVIGVVPPYGWPLNAQTFTDFQKQWRGWSGTGASMYLRPNYMLWGHEQPIITAREWARDFQFAYKNGMIGTDYDSLTSMWATQGPNLYVLSRLHTRPNFAVEKILSEYYGAFGAGKRDVQQYFEYWETQTKRAGQEMQASAAKTEGAQLFGSRAGLHQFVGQIYTAQNYAVAAHFLAVAHNATAFDKATQKRVEFLQAGLEDARLVAKTSLAHDEFKRTAQDEKLISAINELDRHRAQMAQEFPNALNLDLAAWMERDWNRAVYAEIDKALEQGEIALALPQQWQLRWDENQIGERDGWFVNPGEDRLWHPVQTNAPWEAQQVGKDWRAAHDGKDYDGIAWYRVRFKVDPRWRGRKLAFLFGAVDKAATIYLNGQEVGEYPYHNPNDRQTSFEIDVTQYIDFGNENELMVLVGSNSGASGVWKPVWLIAPH